ncbi:UbiH/UbiF/VisC/COQ6 family ubiquinone biosynthesis hydroxylase [Dongia sedimenti]|uniref:UbiH/UbiF/VisC/COQ6 family ubiquinone biosynthesis hydroxylase n=1 Tax=Dongia sedimenti TaxID=3064282 RepID=A0ABU0YPY6_9PROT|nr:UbiH/UbiF/VisC/COQ6 family ubiquinone biosynthesis hydroxylase [Rhodospirillaceae bacterium R-7]
MPQVAPGVAPEVAIVGGGLVGMTLAAATAGAGIPTLLIEAEPLPALTEATFDGRSSAIAYGSQQVLAGVGAWDYLEADVSPIREIRASDGGWRAGLAKSAHESPFFVHYNHRDLPEGAIAAGTQPPFGWIVENRAIRRGLLKRLAETPNLTHIAPARVAEVQFESGNAALRLQDGREIRARLVIAADGRHSAVRRFAGIGFKEFGYNQTAIVCTVAHERDHRGVAHENFLPAGPFAMLPMTDAEGMHRSSIVWTEDPRIVPWLLSLDDESLAAEIERRFGTTLGKLMPIGPRFSYPMRLLLADAYARDGAVLVGDAAHAIHPVAGQGFNLGVRDVAALAEALVDGHRLGLDLGSLAVLENYARWRRFDNLLLTGFTDGLVRLFSNDLPPLRLARDLGFFAFNLAKPLKRMAMRHAMGVVGDLPRLVRGLPL